MHLEEIRDNHVETALKLNGGVDIECKLMQVVDRDPTGTHPRDAAEFWSFNPGFKPSFKRFNHNNTAPIISIGKDIFVHFRGFYRVCAEFTAMKLTFWTLKSPLMHRENTYEPKHIQSQCSNTTSLRKIEIWWPSKYVRTWITPSIQLPCCDKTSSRNIDIWRPPKLVESSGKHKIVSILRICTNIQSTNQIPTASGNQGSAGGALFELLRVPFHPVFPGILDGGLDENIEVECPSLAPVRKKPEGVEKITQNLP
ncbi:hypothetical protein B0H14DRAFT_2599706 [Mycena olivaceomarginata]|nr:hypothetical protein B0H14DRAFT_2599706 [Mycena olivaceomarginata]